MNRGTKKASGQAVMENDMVAIFTYMNESILVLEALQARIRRSWLQPGGNNFGLLQNPLHYIDDHGQANRTLDT
jgi:hypothetical protein